VRGEDGAPPELRGEAITSKPSAGKKSSQGGIALLRGDRFKESGKGGVGLKIVGFSPGPLGKGRESRQYANFTFERT